MPALLLDEFEVEQVLESRKKSNSYRWVEVWEGLYVVPPLPDIRHGDLCGLFHRAFWELLQPMGARCCRHVNISDRNKDWLCNVRCPDAAVFLPGNPARDRFTHWQGGPSLLVEVAMPNDRCRDKLDFYGRIGTGEVLIVDRHPWRLELYRLGTRRMRLKRTVSAGDRKPLDSEVVPMTFQFTGRRGSPKLKITHTETGQEWVG
jgi:Uma2 family endonuclease